MTEDEVRKLASEYVARRGLPVSGITSVKPYPSDFFAIEGGDLDRLVWQATFRAIDDPDEIASNSLVFLDIDDDTGSTTVWPSSLRENREKQ